MKWLRYVLDAVISLALGVGVGCVLGALFIWLWAPAPTPENSSPPPEAFLFFYGLLLGLFATAVGRALLGRLWQRRRRQL
jgi:hypothetical protein